MRNIYKIFIAFGLGGIIGGGTTYLIANKKFNSRIDSEVQSIKELYRSKNDQKKLIIKVNSNERQCDKIEASTQECFKNEKQQNKRQPIDYANYYSNSKQNTQENNSNTNACFVISPDEFETENDYATVYLTYYADGVVTDEADNRIDINSTIGKDVLKHFGEYEENLLHVRSDKDKIYYEVVKDFRKYSDIYQNDIEEEED